MFILTGSKSVEFESTLAKDDGGFSSSLDRDPQIPLSRYHNKKIIIITVSRGSWQQQLKTRCCTASPSKQQRFLLLLLSSANHYYSNKLYPTILPS
jgi:hypothetical protein